MKSAVALACVLFLVCSAQARAVEDDVESRSMIKDKLIKFIDYMESKMEPGLYNILQQFYILRNSIQLSIEYAQEGGLYHQEVIERLFQDRRGAELHEAASKLNLDTYECDKKTEEVMAKVHAHRERIEQCANVTVPPYRLVETCNVYISQIYVALDVVKLQLGKAKKCVEDANIMTSIATAKCLAETTVAAETAYRLHTPGIVALSTVLLQSNQLDKKLHECQEKETFDAIRDEAESVRDELNNCLDNLVISNVNENQSE